MFSNSNRFGRRSFLKTSAAAAGLGLWADLEAYPQNVNRNSIASDLRITDMRIAVLRGPGGQPSGEGRMAGPGGSKAPLPPATPGAGAASGGTIIVRIDTNQGISGYGQTIGDGPQPNYVLAHKARLLGENPCNVDLIFRKIKMHGAYNRQGSGVNAIENALWDLAGKAYGVPIYQMLGGKFRDKIRLYSEGDPRSNSIEDIADDYKERVAAGFTMLKMDLPVAPILRGKPGTMFAPSDYNGQPGENPENYYQGFEISDKGCELVADYVASVKEAMGSAADEVASDGSAEPFPDDNWNKWDLSPKTAGQHFVCVQSVVVDANDDLWVLDPAAPMLMSIVPGGPKLVKIDLKTNKVVRVIPIGPDAAKTSTYLNDVRFDNKRNVAYITDSGLGGIIVVDLATGAAHRKLDGDPSVMPDKSVKIVIDGKPVLGPTGQTPPFHSDAIALSPDGEYLFYQPIASNTLYRVKTDALRDPKPKPTVEKYATTFPVDGIWADEKGDIYLSNLQAKSVSRLTPDRKLQAVVTDSRLEWPDTFSEGPDGSIYITASRINQSPNYNNGKSTRNGPYYVFKFKP